MPTAGLLTVQATFRTNLKMRGGGTENITCLGAGAKALYRDPFPVDRQTDTHTQTENNTFATPLAG